MYCDATILFSSKYIMIIHNSEHDYITWGRVPTIEKMNVLRYELCIFPKSYNQNAKMITLNKGGVWERRLSNFLFKYIRPRLCSWLKVHHHPTSRDGDKYCLHCDLGKHNTTKKR